MTAEQPAPRTDVLANLRAIRGEAMKRRRGEPTALYWHGFDLIGLLDIAIEAEAAAGSRVPEGENPSASVDAEGGQPPPDEAVRDRIAHAVGKALYGWGDDEPNTATGFMVRHDVKAVTDAILSALASPPPTAAPPDQTWQKLAAIDPPATRESGQALRDALGAALIQTERVLLIRDSDDQVNDGIYEVAAALNQNLAALAADPQVPEAGLDVERLRQAFRNGGLVIQIPERLPDGAIPPHDPFRWVRVEYARLSRPDAQDENA